MSNTVKYRRRGGVEKSFESVTRARNPLVLEHNGYIGTTIDPLTRHHFFSNFFQQTLQTVISSRENDKMVLISLGLVAEEACDEDNGHVGGL